MAALLLQQQCWVVVAKPTKTEVFAIWSFVGSVLTSTLERLCPFLGPLSLPLIWARGAFVLIC